LGKVRLSRTKIACQSDEIARQRQLSEPFPQRNGIFNAVADKD
jgi:hypothetical protein